ncbi:MAG: DUF1116 domain-containing protein [Clostridiales bacterium]|jgi:hypothetical protein|nr:DUF1116 domain-containing protein [Clostridiales bacterium]
MSNLLNQKPKIINAGLDIFADANTLHLDWRPPGNGKSEINEKLKQLSRRKEIIDAANEKALEKVLNAQPVWTDVGIAKDTIPGFTENTIAHAGPPVAWENMCGPMQGSVIGALIYEGKAKTEEEARKIAPAMDFIPCHHLNAVGPMAGVFSANMPVIVVENKENGNLAYSPFNTEGRCKPFSFGAFEEETIAYLHSLRDEMMPALKKALQVKGDGIDLKMITAQALHMGDDCHNRLVAATGQLWKALVPELAKSGIPHGLLINLSYTMYYNNWYFLNFSMAASKATMDAARGIENSTLVTVMARNGTEVGIQVSGSGDKWFTTKAPKVRGMYFPAYTEADANPDMGDSAITETAGIGAFAMAAALPMTQLVGGTIQDAIGFTKNMRKITIGESRVYTIPTLNFIGSPTGIDVIKVIETGIEPIINTGIAHKNAGIGMVGAGLVNMPIEAFEKALLNM